MGTVDTSDFEEYGTFSFSAHDIITALEAEGITGGECEQTGGGTATMYWPLPGGTTLAMGPGNYYGADQFDTAELFAGIELRDADGAPVNDEMIGEVNFSYDGDFSYTFPGIVAALVELARDHSDLA